jgi:puromycin-sensitive aminopeptidase
MFRLPETVRPEQYTLHLTVDPREERFQGEATIKLGLAEGVRAFAVHSADLDLEEVRLDDARGPVPVRERKVRARQETVELRLGRALRSGPVTLHVTYTGPIRQDLRGLYHARSGRRRYAVTQLEATDARRVFPCFDEPAMKARFKVRVTTPVANTVVSNAPEIRSERRGRWKTVEFAETPKLPTYLIALIVGELEGSRVRRCGRTPIRVWHVPGKGGLTGFALEAAAASLARLERYFALPYPYEKLDLIAVPDFEFGAMENAGAVTFRESLLLVDPKTVTLQEKKRVAEVIAHELAHMWYGDLVTMAWWDDLWLNEAFATWMAFAVVDEWKPEWQMWLDFEHHRAAAFSLDALRNTHPIYTTVRSPEEATENFDVITYEKGASVVRMLERWLGAPTFRKGVRRYIRRHREANARAQDLWKALEEASGRPVAPVVRSWIERPGFPLVEAKRADRAGKARLDVRQDRFFASPRLAVPNGEPPWPVPLVVRVRPVRGRTRLVRDLLEDRQASVPLGSSSEVRWAYSNADEGGFYRVLHDGDSLQSFVSDRARLAPVERLGLVGHQWAALRANRAELSDLLAVVEAYRDEEEAEALEALLGPLGFLKDPVAWVAGEAVDSGFREWLAAAFRPGFRELGWRPRRGESDQVRLRRAALLRIVGGLAEDAEIEDEANEALRRYLKERRTLDPNLAGSVVDIAARHGSERLYGRYLREMKRAATPQERMRFEMALGAFRDPALVQRTLELALTNEIPTQDVALLIGRMLGARHPREATWEFVQKRWEELAPRIPSGLASRLVLALPALHTRAHRREVAAFFRAHPVPTARRALRQALERFDLDHELRRRIAPALRRYLREGSVSGPTA